MRDTKSQNWKQTEWFGFYFQELCKKWLVPIGMRCPGSKYGRTEFDGFFAKMDWDFKAHCIQNQKGTPQNTLICNDLEATTITIKKHGKTALLVANGVATYDDPSTMEFKMWVRELSGGEVSAYSMANMERGARSRLRKTSFRVTSIEVYLLGDTTIVQQLDELGDFQTGMRNSNGKPRRPKLQLNLTKMKPYLTVSF